MKCGLCTRPALLRDALRATLHSNIYRCPGIYAAMQSMRFSLLPSFSKRFIFKKNIFFQTREETVLIPRWVISNHSRSLSSKEREARWHVLFSWHESLTPQSSPEATRHCALPPGGTPPALGALTKLCHVQALGPSQPASLFSAPATAGTLPSTG